MNVGKLIGIGNTAGVYDWEEGKVLKLFHQGYPCEAVKNEYHNAIAIKDMDFAKSIAYEMITYEGRDGIIYEKLEGDSLLDLALKTGNIQECALCMAKTHRAIFENQISKVPNYKDFLKFHIQNAALKKEKTQEVLNKIENLPDGNTLCHGDFHPGNILISKGKAYVIDYMNICHGDFLYDIARTVFLIEYTPVPADVKDRNMVLQFKKALSDLYLTQMNVTRDMIQDYLSIIIIARKGECPGELNGEL